MSTLKTWFTNSYSHNNYVSICTNEESTNNFPYLISVKKIVSSQRYYSIKVLVGNFEFFQRITYEYNYNYYGSLVISAYNYTSFI